MIDLLSGLERSLSLASDVSVKLRGHVAQIETYMDQAARTAQQSQVFHSVVPQYTLNTTSISPSGPTAFSTDHNNAGNGVIESTTTTGDPAGQLDLWADDFTFEWPSDHQIALQTDLTENWPFDVGGGLYDFFGEGPGNMPAQGNGSNTYED
jgi:hypothetical protein